VKAGDHVVIAKGGAGGRGNSKNYEAEYGSPGEEKRILLELKLIADVGMSVIPIQANRPLSQGYQAQGRK